MSKVSKALYDAFRAKVEADLDGGAKLVWREKFLTPIPMTRIRVRGRLVEIPDRANGQRYRRARHRELSVLNRVMDDLVRAGRISRHKSGLVLSGNHPPTAWERREQTGIK